MAGEACACHLRMIGGHGRGKFQGVVAGLTNIGRCNVGFARALQFTQHGAG